MKTVATIESLWRYPVKSMAGQETDMLFMGFSGFYGDRMYAFHNSAARKGFPYLNATAQPLMLRFQPQFRFPQKTLQPPNLAEASSIAPGVTPSNAPAADLALDVITADGKVLAIDDPALAELLTEGLRGKNQITLQHSDRALTDCRPVSMISLQTIQQLQKEADIKMDKRRFRSNIYLDLNRSQGFAENNWIGRRLRIGKSAEIMVLERDPRCKMISLDPDTGEHNPQVLRYVAQNHNNIAGIYCAVLVEGMVSKNDTIRVIS